MLEVVLRAALIYLFILVLFRMTGARTLAQSTPFDVVLLLIVSEATQQAMIGDDNSLSTAFTAILTLVGLDYALTTLRRRTKFVHNLLESSPRVLFYDGKFDQVELRRESMCEEDILCAVRESYGMENLDKVKSAILESSGRVSFILKQTA